MEDRNLFHRVDTIGNVFTSGAATSENITDGVHANLGLCISAVKVFENTVGKGEIACDKYSLFISCF